MQSSQFTTILFLLLLLVFAPSVFAQSDGEKFAEGRIAMDKHNDCTSALDSFQSMSAQSKKDPTWIYYMAKVKECLNDQEEALDLYTKYNLLRPGTGEIVDKIGELSYEVKITKKTLSNFIDSSWSESVQPIKYIFKSGGQVSRSFGGSTINGTWTLIGNEITIIFKPENSRLNGVTKILEEVEIGKIVGEAVKGKSILKLEVGKRESIWEIKLDK